MAEATSDAVETIKIGDRVCLEAERLNGATGAPRYVSTASAATNQAMGVKEQDELENEGFWARAVFVVQAHSTWTRMQNFKMLLEQTGIDLLEAPGNPGRAPGERLGARPRPGGRTRPPRLGRP